MQLDDLIKQERIGNVTKQTHITKAVLERILNREFQSLKRSQVYGVLSILEREYSVDLNEFRNECEEYFQANKTDDNSFVVMETIPKNNHFLLRFVVLLIIVSIVYGGWYFFHSYYNSSANNSDPQNEKTLIDIILEGRDTIVEKVSGKSSDSDSVEIENQEITDQNATLEANVVTTTTQIQKTQEASEEESKQVVAKDIQTIENRQITQESSENSVDSNTDMQSNESNSEVMSNNEVEANRSVEIDSIKREKITLLPQKVMKFELMNLKTKRLLKFKRKDQYDINVKNDSWLYSSKDTVFAFIDNDIFEEYGGAGEIFFRLDHGGIHPLTKDEYKIALKLGR